MAIYEVLYDLVDYGYPARFGAVIESNEVLMILGSSVRCQKACSEISIHYTTI
jgi:hypothetical protein